MAYVLTKSVEFNSNSGPRSKYPFGDMVVGDAFVFPKEQKDKVTPAASYHGIRNPGVKFSVRKYASEQYPDGYACKRIA